MAAGVAWRYDTTDVGIDGPLLRISAGTARSALLGDLQGRELVFEVTGGGAPRSVASCEDVILEQTSDGEWRVSCEEPRDLCD